MNATPVRRDEILRKAAELFATKGVAGTTVRDIGDVTGVLSGSLYHHFKSKNAMVSEILERYQQDIHQRFAAAVSVSSSPTKQVRGLILETLRVIDDHPHPTAIYANDRQYLRENGLLEPVDEASRAVRTYWIKAIEAGVAEGQFRDDIPAEVFYRSVRDTLWSTMHWPSRRHYSTPDFAQLVTRLFFTGFAHPSWPDADGELVAVRQANGDDRPVNGQAQSEPAAADNPRARRRQVAPKRP